MLKSNLRMGTKALIIQEKMTELLDVYWGTTGITLSN